MSNNKPSESVNETIIQIQSIMLMALAMASINASSTIIACFNALTNANSAAYIITDNAIVTNTETISIEDAQRIIGNFEFVSYCIFTIGIIIFISSFIRILKKLKC